jgi:oxygen-independent coproporphyrinogen-3 oxidase
MNTRLKTLLQKYDVAGPRYTSYPTAPVWTPMVTEYHYRKALGSLRPDGNLSLYVHLPFCENLCHFCGCMTVITKDHSRSQEYVETLLQEIDRVASLLPQKMKVSQLHFGGGTPNFLQPEELKQIVDRARTLFDFLPDAEVAIEMHPRTSTKEFCEMLAALNFNRISLGVQDFDPKVQKLINRHQSYEMTADMIALLRTLGFSSFNFDLIYGLPGQTFETWSRTLEQVLQLKPNRLAVYSYAHVPWLKPYQRSFEDKDLPEPQTKLELFEKAYETFTQNGYRLIGMDHFCLEDDDLAKALDDGSIHRNFMGYSTRADAHQIGFGVSAISYTGGNYFQNEKELGTYQNAIRDERLATYRGHLLSEKDRMHRNVIARIMCTGVIDFDDFSDNWAVGFEENFSAEILKLKGFVEDGLVEIDTRGIHVTKEGFLFLRNIAMIFDSYLDAARGNANNPVFSRTI